MSRLQARFKLAYGGFNLDVDLDVPAEGVTVVYGPSGCGKTTLMRCLAGLEKAPAGFCKMGEEVWQDGPRAIFVPPYRRPIGTVFQEPRLFPHLTVRANLLYGFNRTPLDKRRIQLDQIVDLMGLEQLLGRGLKGLSGGEQQRIAIGRALLTSPSLLLMDEPLANLDARRKLEILPFLARLQKDLRLPIVYVSHSINEVLQLVNTLVLMEKGAVVACGPINDVMSQSGVMGDFAQHSAGTAIETIVAEHDRQFGLTRLEHAGQSLFVPRQSIPVGQGLRLYILAKDVSIVLDRQAARTSVLNILEARIAEIMDDGPEGYSVKIKLDIGGPLLAAITKKSLAGLGLRPGQKVFAHIKAVKLAPELDEF